MSSASKTYFSGLDALRFFAASFVVVQHIQDNQFTQGLPYLPEYAFLNKGVAAVTFFFTLSGFLITYLLLEERKNTNDVKIRQFYIRRVLRIWPLYFIIVIVGFVLYWALLPTLGIATKNQYPLIDGLLYFVFMMPNVANQYFQVGGILIILWSIGVEEQFYLIWAPLMKFCKQNILYVLLILFWVSIFIHLVNYEGLLGVSSTWQAIISELQFHYMAAGGMLAYGAFYHKQKLLQWSVFTKRTVQWVLLTALLAYFLFIPGEFINEYLRASIMPFLFAWLIVNVSINPNKVFGLQIPVLKRLGHISYGIYMYHMIVIYAVSYVTMKTGIYQKHPVLFQSIYHLSVVGVTLTLAHFSYQYIEKPFLRMRSYFVAKDATEAKKVEINYSLKSYDTI